MTARLSPQTLDGASLTRLDPEWDNARELRDAARGLGTGAVQKICALVLEIERLRGLFLQPPGLRHGSESQLVIQKNRGGFQAQLEAQLGLQPEQARRLLERGRYMAMLRAIAEGKEVKYLTGTGQKGHEKTFVPNKESQERALGLLDAVIAGDEKPSAAWAGLVGEETRIAQTGKKERQAVNHYRNCERAIAKWSTSLEHYYNFTPPQQGYLDATWEELLDAGVIPEKWLMTAAKRQKEGRS
jgi:hypothetical protein